MGNINIFLQDSQDIDAVGNGKTFRTGQFIPGNPVFDQQFPAHPVTDGLQHHQRQFHPVLQAAAERIGAGIVLR